MLLRVGEFDMIPESKSPLPGLVVHADWSMSPKKRWMVMALHQSGLYTIYAPELVGALDTFFAGLLGKVQDSQAVLAGFDFPIGLPQAYAELVGVRDFITALPGLPDSFFSVAKTHEEISLERPFYPFRPGGTCRKHLLDGLQLTQVRQLLRRCELATPTRNSASPLFWTLGAKQVGRAALCGWKELLIPALKAFGAEISVWPFDGNLGSLIATRRLVITETYPAEGYEHFGFPRSGWSKRAQADRKRYGKRLLDWAEQRNGAVCLDPLLIEILENGFGPEKDGEDPFDALVGLCSMLEVVLGHRADGAPDDPIIRKVEGWILGQPSDWPS